MKKIEEFLAYAKENPNVSAEIDAIVSKAKENNPNGIDEDTRSKVIETELIPLAKKYGYEVTLEDFESDEEVSMEDADAVAGGSCKCIFNGQGTGTGCVCSMAGGGGGTEDGKSKGNEGGKTYGCACVGYGQGGNGDPSDANCLCVFSGNGHDCQDLL